MWWGRSARCSTRLRPRKRSNTTAPFARLLRVYGDSMAPTLRAGELVVVSERTYDTRPPQRGDIVAVRPAAFGGRAFVKRIAALPHERLTFDGREWRLGADEFFLLGDHPGDSLDSRTFGPVTRPDLIGPIHYRLWPWTIF